MISASKTFIIIFDNESCASTFVYIYIIKISIYIRNIDKNKQIYSPNDVSNKCVEFISTRRIRHHVAMETLTFFLS